VIYSLLGELEIGGNDRLLDLPGDCTLVGLAALLINANRRISKTELIGAVWASDGVDVAQLHKRVMEARNVLAQIGGRDDLKTHPRLGYEFRVAEGDLDMLLFHRLVRDADEAGAERRADDEIACLRRALALWRGPDPLANVPSAAFSQEIAGLKQRHKRAAVRLFNLEIARGNHGHILDELILTAGYYPRR
jgi:DNA-binding winged helix-turn-helix (wHTH) protein